MQFGSLRSSDGFPSRHVVSFFVCSKTRYGKVLFAKQNMAVTNCLLLLSASGWDLTGPLQLRGG